MEAKIPDSLFGMPLAIAKDEAVTLLPRAVTDAYEVQQVLFGAKPQARCHGLFPKKRPGAKSIRAAIKALGRIDDLPSVVFWPGLSYGQKDSLSSEGIPYVQDARNAFLPFIGAIAASTPNVARPTPLSAQAQRIFLNYLSGRWIDCNAGDIAKLAGKSRASVTKYLAELTAVCPGIVTKEGKNSYLRQPTRNKAELLDLFEPYLFNPVVSIHRYSSKANVDELHALGAKLAGISELAALTDIADDGSVLEIAMDAVVLAEFEEGQGDALAEAGWDDDASLVVHEWAYPIDSSINELSSAYGLDGLDVENLYVSLSKTGYDDVRILDAIEQVRNLVCQ